MSYHKYGLGVVPDPYSVFNPPDYWNQMINNPTQLPYQVYPYGGGYAVPPGLYYGQRTFTQEDAQRAARERQDYMEHRAEVSSDPSHKYLTAEGKLDPRAAEAMRRARASQPRPEDPIKKIQKRMIVTVLIGAVLSTLLK